MGSADLHQLERLDTEIERQRTQVAELRRQQARNAEVEAAQARFAGLQPQEREAAAAQRALEVELSEVETKIKRDHTRLYSGQIVDSRELASLERELQHYRTNREAIEERLLAAMERLEGLQAATQEAGRVATASRQNWEESLPLLARQTEEMTDALAKLESDRETLAASIDPRQLTQYTRLRASLGHAVAVVSDGVCSLCRVTLPPKDIQHARSGAIVTCMNCGRILSPG